MLIFKKQIKKQEESGHVMTQETWKKSLKEANKVSLEKNIQSEFRQAVDTMIRRPSRKRRFLKKDNSKMRALFKRNAAGRGGWKRKKAGYILAKKLNDARGSLCRRPRYLKPKPFLVFVTIAGSFSSPLAEWL